MAGKTYSLPRITTGGYDVYECISALQKAIRRAQPELAYFWALELEGVGLLSWPLARLRVIAHEDVGLGDPPAVTFALAALDQTAEWHKAKKDSWYMSLGNAIIALAYAQKSRAGDEFQAYVRGKIADGWKPAVPDEALDKHTLRGKRMGRGMEHFLTEGAVLVSPPIDLEELVERTRAAEWHPGAERYWRSLGTRLSEDEGVDGAAPTGQLAL